MQRKIQLEKHFQKSVLKRLKTLANSWVYKASDRSKKGIPDIIMCLDQSFVALELKRSAQEKATPLQKHTLEEICMANGYAWVIHPGNWEMVWEMLLKLAGGTK